RSRDLLEKAGGATYIGTLAADIPSAANIKAYAGIIREHATLRRLIRAGDQITSMAFEPSGQSADDIVGAAETEIFAIAEQGRRAGAGPVGLNTLLTQAVNRIEKLVAHEGSLSGLPTGLNEFDKMTNGMHTSDLLILAGRRCMGKSSLAMNIVETVAIEGQVPAAVFSLGMLSEQLVLLMFSSWGGVDQSRLRSGRLPEEDWPKIPSAIGIMNENARLFIDDTPGLSPAEMRARARRLKREHDIGLIVVDYLQLMSVPGT